jgi:hypothetical protein
MVPAHQGLGGFLRPRPGHSAIGSPEAKKAARQVGLSGTVKQPIEVDPSVAVYGREDSNESQEGETRE